MKLNTKYKIPNTKYVIYIIVALIFILGVALFYGNTLQNGFVLDDVGVLQQNPYIHSLEYLPKVITGCIWESVLGGCSSTNYYRPLFSLSYLLTYQISPDPWLFALIRLIYFTISIFLVFILVNLLTKNTLLAFLSAFIFLIYPTNNEAINFSVPDLLYTIFILLATIYHFLYQKQKKQHYLTFVYIFYGLAVFSKETAIVAPLIFLTLDLTYFKRKISWFLQWENIKPYLIYILIFAVYMGLRMLVLGGMGARSSFYPLTIPERIYAFFYLFTLYIQKFFLPYPLQFSYPTIANILPRFFSLNFLISIFIVISFIGLCIYTWKKKLFSAFFGLIWFFVFLFLNLFFVSTFNTLGGNAFTERYMLAPSIGFSILVAILLEKLWKINKKTKYGVIAFLIIISLISFMIVHNRNKTWNSNLTIYLDTLKKDPSADVIRYDLAAYYQNQKDMKQAKEQFNELIKRGTLPYIFTVYNTLGKIYYDEGNLKEALRFFEGSLNQNSPGNAKDTAVYLAIRKEADNYIGTIYAKQDNILQSLSYFCKALMIDPNYNEANTNFNAAASGIQGMDNKSFMLLYDQILQGTIFQPNNSLITLKNKDCSLPQGCLLILSSTIPKDTPPFIFLTVGKTDLDEVVRARYLTFDPKTSDITLGIDHQFGDRSIHFWFPTCNNVYYESETKGE